MDPTMLEKTILLVWLYFIIRILFVTYWDALFLPPILLALDRLFQNSKSDNATQTEDDHFQAGKEGPENNEVNKKHQNLTKEDDFQKITTPAVEKFTTTLKISTNAERDVYLGQPIAKIQELISDLQNSLKSDSINGPDSPNSTELTSKLENPSKKSIPTNKISACSEKDIIKNNETSPALVKIQELIFDLKNSLE
ncbi:hypothetical protein TNCV_1372741 [Trichonephila clavipes]|uniref:Uncharacterized protein n=1 Tax=Trichonephila clavipes TaxID=2585209 RepID=A0A8X6WGP5_TRICX|nr:hypothetical protein TNCV_1372741 [Trichonephila clavipes]